MARKLTISGFKDPVLKIYRNVIQNDELVYILQANKKVQYTIGSSKIVYIGTTASGVKRIAQSVAHRAQTLLATHGITHLHVYVLSPTRKVNVQTWKKLEMGLIIAFREMHGEIPLENKQGKNKQWSDELKYFNLQTLRDKVDKYS